MNTLPHARSKCGEGMGGGVKVKNGNKKIIKFIDLFCGIGGIRRPFEELGGKCVFSSDYDKFSQVTYEANYGEKPHGDITKVPLEEIPKHDLLLAGFPCQPFSISGVSKKNSLHLPHGFKDKTQGTLFFEIAKILDAKKPQAFLLENVKNLKSHDGGKTFLVIRSTLEELGYTIAHDQVIDASLLLPQHRERVYIIGFKNKVKFGPIKIEPKKMVFKDILEPGINGRYTLSDHLWLYLQNYAKKHKENGNGFGFGLVNLNGVSRTLSARYHKDGSEILIPQQGKNPRRLTPRECARLMGYPDTFKIPVSDTQAYRQFGNSVAVPVVRVLAKEIMRCLQKV